MRLVAVLVLVCLAGCAISPASLRSGAQSTRHEWNTSTPVARLADCIRSKAYSMDAYTRVTAHPLPEMGGGTEVVIGAEPGLIFGGAMVSFQLRPRDGGTNVTAYVLNNISTDPMEAARSFTAGC